MRITGGIRRGMKILSPPDRQIRPTPDIVRESFFNIIGQNLEGVRFLDLFCGTGAVGLEALSRGASWCSFVDKSSEAVNLCKENVRKLSALERTEILQIDAFSAPAYFFRIGRVFDAVFAGPPFNMEISALEKLLYEIENSNILTKGCIFTIQVSRKIELVNSRKMEIVKERVYGRNKLIIFSMGS